MWTCLYEKRDGLRSGSNTPATTAATTFLPIESTCFLYLSKMSQFSATTTTEIKTQFLANSLAFVFFSLANHNNAARLLTTKL